MHARRRQTAARFTMGIVNADALSMRSLREIMLDLVPEAHILWTERDGREAVKHCIADRIKPDLVLIDLLLYGLQCGDACLLIRRRSASIKLLIMQTFPMADSRSMAARAGAQGLIGKDDDAAIANALKTVAADGTMPGFPTAEEAHRRIMERLGTADNRLTVREMEIMGFMADGASNEAVCASLGIGSATLRRHLQDIRIKLHARTNVQAVLTWLQGG